jgi:putative aminopeptidase FrvX
VKELVKKLTEAYGPSGHEANIRQIIREEIRGYADEIRTNALGSLVALKRGNGRGKKVMVAAHMDEIGVMVTHIDDRGFCRFTNVGGVFPLNVLGGRVVFGNGTVGVIGVETKRMDRTKVPALDQFFIDVGARDKAACSVKVGDAAGFMRTFEDLGERLVSKTMDDRIGCAVAIEALRQLRRSPHDVYFVFTVQEEVTLAGAGTSAYGIDPDMALAVDVTLVGDTPEANTMAVSLGQGPAIKVKDAGMVAHGGVKDLMVRRAEEAGLPYQLEVLTGGTTDAMAIQLVREGIPSGCLSIPCRYVHSPSEMVDYGDVQNSVKLLLAILSKPIEL